jgi:cytochrome bd-type quinol oxidase subunit 2
MSESEQTRTERYYRAYQRGAVTGLVFMLAAAGFLLAVLTGAVGEGAGRNLALLIFALFFVTLVAVHVITLRGGRWRPGAPRERLVLTMTLGAATFCASYLHRSSREVNG